MTAFLWWCGRRWPWLWHWRAFVCCVNLRVYIHGWLWRHNLLPSIRCADCRRCTWGEVYMVHDHLWEAAGMAPDGGFLCIGCLETRLGRRLAPADFRGRGSG